MKRVPITYRIEGGANLVDAKSLLKPGTTTGGKNMEVVQGAGLRRMDGYERFNGNEAHRASTGTYTKYSYDLGGNAVMADGLTVVGATSAATGIVCGNASIATGTIAAGTAAGELHLFVLTGAFQSGEQVTISGSYRARLTSAAAVATIGDPERKSGLRGARNYKRGLCTPPSGSGGILGVVSYSGVVYCFKNNALGTAAILHKSSAAGWVVVPFDREIAFTAGSGTVLVGDVLSRGGNTATIKKIIYTSGSFSGGNAAGSFIITTPAPGEFTAGAATTAGGAVTLAGASTAITFAPNGRFEFLVHNFGGSTTTMRIYGCDTANRGFEFNPFDDVLAPINTGMTVDKPTHLTAHMGRLWFSFPRGSVQWSSPNEPFIWSVIVGAGEIALGDEVTAIRALKQDSLAVMGRNSASVMYGSSFINANFVKLLDTTGCIAYTLDEIAGSTVSLDNLGAYFLEATQAIGDYKPNALSRVVRPLVEAGGVNAKCAIVVRDKAQYRIYFADKTGITATFAGSKLIGWFPFTLAHQVTCVWAGEDATGNEVLYGGLDNGHVVQLDIGTSHDGTTVESVIPLAPNPVGATRRYKKFFSVVPQIETPAPIEIQLLMEFDFGGTPGDSFEADTPATGGQWGQATWGQFYWGSPIVATPSFDIEGIAVYAQPIFRHVDDVDEPWSIQANTIEYAYLGQVR